MTKLNQIVAIEKGVKETANKQTAPLFHSLKVPALYVGLTQTYKPLDEEGERLPDDNTPVQMTVSRVLTQFRKPMERLFDVLMTKETANTEAFADVVLSDGTVLIGDAPVSFLLQFEKQLAQEVRGLIAGLPVLDPTDEWSESTSSADGVYETPEFQTHRNKKVTKPIVLYPATDKHPAQTQLVNEDILAGYWHKKKFSGAIPASRKQELLERVDELIRAVKFAREQANDREVQDKKVGSAVFDYLFA